MKIGELGGGVEELSRKQSCERTGSGWLTRTIYNIAADTENMAKRTGRDKSLLVAGPCVRAACVYADVCVFLRVRVRARTTAWRYIQ